MNLLVVKWGEKSFEKLSIAKETTLEYNFGQKMVEKSYPDRFNMTCFKNKEYLFSRVDLSKLDLKLNLSRDATVFTTEKYTCSFQHDYLTKMNLPNKNITLLVDSAETKPPQSGNLCLLTQVTIILLVSIYSIVLNFFSYFQTFALHFSPLFLSFVTNDFQV